MNGAPNGTLITVTSSLGTILTPDASSAYVGTQVAVSGGVISFQLQSPTKTGTPTIDLQSTQVGVNWSEKQMENLPYGRGIRGVARLVLGSQASEVMARAKVPVMICP